MSFAFFSDTKCHSFGLGSKSDQACNLCIRFQSSLSSLRQFIEIDFLNAHIEQTVFFEFTLGIEVGHQEAIGRLFILVLQFSH